VNLIRQIKTVLWSFVGLGRRQDASEIQERGNPLVLILIAFSIVLAFLATLAFIAHMAAKGLA